MRRVLSLLVLLVTVGAFGGPIIPSNNVAGRLARGCYSHYTFDEAIGINVTSSNAYFGSTVSDSNGNVRMEVYGPSQSATSVLGNATRFVAAESDTMNLRYLLDGVVHEKFATAFTPFSLSCWIKWAGGGGVLPRVFQQESDGGGAAHLGWVAFDPSSNDALIWRYYDGDTTNYAQWLNKNLVNSLRDSNWHHIVAVYDGAPDAIFPQGMVLYCDTNANQSNSGRVGAMNTGGDILFTRFGDSSANTWDGYYDEFRFYDRALSSDEIGRLYNEGAGYGKY